LTIKSIILNILSKKILVTNIIIRVTQRMLAIIIIIRATAILITLIIKSSCRNTWKLIAFLFKYLFYIFEILYISNVTNSSFLATNYISICNYIRLSLLKIIRL